MSLTPSAFRIACSDLSATSEFYANKLGFEYKSGTVEQGFIVYSTDNIDIILENEDEEMKPRFLGISFGVPDIFSAVQKLENQGVEFDGNPQKQFWGGWPAHFQEPSGNTLTLVQY